jgi:hypothetical protein
MNNKDNVTAAKPKIGGAVWRAPIGTTLPTNASAELDKAFVGLGYISEDGLSNSGDISTTNIKAWGGDTVMTAETDKTDEFKFELIEGLSAEVLKTVHGEGNVTGDLNSGMTVKVNSDEHTEYVWVADMVLRGNVLKRVVVPSAKVTAVDEVSYSDSDPVGYGITLTATPDSDGNTHYEYFQKSDTKTSAGSEE